MKTINLPDISKVLTDQNRTSKSNDSSSEITDKVKKNQKENLIPENRNETKTACGIDISMTDENEDDYETF